MGIHLVDKPVYCGVFPFLDDSLKDELAGSTAICCLIKNNKIFCVSITNISVLKFENYSGKQRLGKCISSKQDLVIFENLSIQKMALRF